MPRYLDLCIPDAEYQNREQEYSGITDILAYSDSLGTRQKCHCSQSVTVGKYTQWPTISQIYPQGYMFGYFKVQLNVLWALHLLKVMDISHLLMKFKFQRQSMSKMILMFHVLDSIVQGKANIISWKCLHFLMFAYFRQHGQSNQLKLPQTWAVMGEKVSQRPNINICLQWHSY